ncbi:MAG: hypothetical protein L3J71_00830 [Victivallaceae bacterium]|nr:hypothetical protein [Victivallaceae bacterium]
MFSSKLFLGIAVFTLLLICATLTFQIMEAQTYNLFETLQERFIGGGGEQQATSTSSEEAQ